MSGLSIVPTVSIVTPGIMSAESNTVEPHTGQKFRCVALPLSPELSNWVVFPVTVIDAVGMATTGKKAEPVSFWHDVQWQSPTKIGSADAS